MAVAHPFLTHDPVVWITTISGMGVAWAGVYFRYVRPERRQHEKDKSDAADKRRESDKWMYGGRNLDGTVSKGAPEKLYDVENVVERLSTQVTGIATGQATLERRMDEANGTGQRTEKKLDELTELVKGAATVVADAKLVSANGESHVVALADDAKDALLTTIHQHDET